MFNNFELERGKGKMLEKIFRLFRPKVPCTGVPCTWNQLYITYHKLDVALHSYPWKNFNHKLIRTSTFYMLADRTAFVTKNVKHIRAKNRLFYGTQLLVLQSQKWFCRHSHTWFGLRFSVLNKFVFLWLLSQVVKISNLQSWLKKVVLGLSYR